MDLIECEVLKREGVGFTVELFPLIIKREKYVKKPSTTSNPDEYIWEWESSKPFGSYGEPDWDIKLDHISVDELPQGIIIEQTIPVVLLDERLVTSRRKTAEYIEGRRVFLKVSNEYASETFKQIYTDIGLPFRDRLLENYNHILRKIIVSINDDCCGRKFSVNFEKISYDAKCEYYDEYDGLESYIGSDDIYFSEFYMKPLGSVGQMYGMALAIIEKLKDSYFSFCNSIFTISREISQKDNYDNIVVEFHKNLQDW